MCEKFKIRLADWQLPSDQSALRLIRTQVFINEQYVPPSLEWDQEDNTATHLLACDTDQTPIGCARLIMSSDLNPLSKNSGKIGRMAVLPAWRNLGVGTALLQAAIDYFQTQGIQTVLLSAQVQAIGFYQRAGFVVSSQPYQDAGIAHVDMQLVTQRS